MTTLNYRLEDAASMVFATGEPTSEEMADTYQLSRALGLTSCDSWTIETLRQAHVLASLAKDVEHWGPPSLAPYVDTAKEFGYAWPADHVLVVTRVGSKVMHATVSPSAAVARAILRLDWSKFSPATRRLPQRVLVVRRSTEVEFYAGVAAA